MKLIYVADPMCSWCYGFGGELASVMNKVPNLEVEIVVGGLAAGSTQVLDDAGKQFRLTHWVRVEAMSGASFNREALLARQNFVYDTEPVCRAVVAARHIAPQAELLKVFRALQRAFYVDGLDTTNGTVLAQVAANALKEQGIDVEAERFEEVWESDAVIRETIADFRRTQQLGVSGFPSLFAEKGGKLYRVNSGFASAQQVQGALETLAAA
jgi:putative protein-disulfide isomerase